MHIIRRSLLFILLISSIGLTGHAQARVASAPIVVTGDDGIRVTLPQVPTRLISLAPSVTETLFALGLGARVVAVDANSDYPRAALTLPKIATFSAGPNGEKILALKPDLIVAAQGIYSQASIAKLRALHLRVLVTGPTTLTAVLRTMILIGTATGVEAAANTVVAGLRARIDAVKARLRTVTSRPRVYYEVDTTYYTAGHGSFIDSLITLAGGTNIAGTVQNPYPQLSAEKIIAADPQFILLGDAAYGGTVAAVEARPGWRAISAVKDGHVYAFDDNLASRPGPRLVRGLEVLAHLLHPEAA